MLLRALLKQAMRRLLPLKQATVVRPMPLGAEDVPSTIRIDEQTEYVPDTEPIDGWRELAERQAYRAAWLRRQALRFGAATRGEAHRQARRDPFDRPRSR